MPQRCLDICLTTKESVRFKIHYTTTLGLSFDPTVTVKCRIVIKALFHYFNVSKCKVRSSLSCSYTSISFLTDISLFFVRC